MFVYTLVRFPGVYPVGSCAVIVAPNKVKAWEVFLLEVEKNCPQLDFDKVMEWSTRAMHWTGDQDPMREFVRWAGTCPSKASILLDGDY
jgi:hypothetical protein